MTQVTARIPRTPSNVPSPLIALAGWVLPGSGYWILGERKRAVIVGSTILLLYVVGLLLAGVRVIEVPGYDRMGNPVRVDARGAKLDPDKPGYDGGSWVLVSRGWWGEILNKPWFVGQVLAGPISILSAFASLALARQGVPMPHARLAEIGTLYAAVAGMLNLIAIIDAAHRAGLDDEGEDGQ